MSVRIPQQLRQQCTDTPPVAEQWPDTRTQAIRSGFIVPRRAKPQPTDGDDA